MQERDLSGCGADPPRAGRPDGARVAVSLVMNVEEGAARAVSRGDPLNEPVCDLIDEIREQPDPAVARVSSWRIASFGAAAGRGAAR